MTDQEDTFTVHAKSPYVQIPKILRYLSFMPKDGNAIRLNSDHFMFLAYISELDTFTKIQDTIMEELGWGDQKLKKIIRELKLPTVEMGVPLLSIVSFTGIGCQKRSSYVLYQNQEKMGKRFDELYNKENGKACRDSWILQWSLGKKTKDEKPKGENHPWVKITLEPKGENHPCNDPNQKDPNSEVVRDDPERSPISEIKIKEKDGSTTIINRTELIRVVVNKKVDWSIEEIDYGWKALINYDSAIYDWWKFLEGTIVRNREHKKRASRENSSQGSSHKSQNRNNAKCKSKLHKNQKSYNEFFSERDSSEQALPEQGLILKLLNGYRDGSLNPKTS